MIRTACGGADLLSHPGARGGLDARLGASLAPREDVSPGSHREEPQERTCAPYGAPPTRAGVEHCPRLDAGGVLMWAQETVTWPVVPPRSNP
jgi:hypothetical protein